MSASNRTTLIGLLGAALITGCDAGGAGAAREDGVGVAVPERLLQSRMLDRSTLRPEVTLSTGQRVPMRRVDDGLWSGTVMVRPDQDIVVTVYWIAELDGRSLPLARRVQTTSVGADGGALSLQTSDYDYALDLDGDGTSNLDEIEAGDDPFTGEDDPSDDALPNAPDTGDDDRDDDNDDDNDDDRDDDSQGDERPDDDDDDDDDGIDPDDDERDDDGVVDPAPGEPAVPQQAGVDVFVPRVARGQAPAIDGMNVRVDGNGQLVGEWAAAVQVDTGGAPLGINNLMIDLGAEAPSGTPWRRWAAVHDGTDLYVLILVDDDGQRRADSELFWQDDSIELFLDGDHGRASRYEDDDDHHVIVPLLEPGTAAGGKRANSTAVAGYRAGPFSSGTGLVLDLATGPGIGPDGLRRPRYEQDAYELRIALTSIGVTPGQPFGFELQVNDDDDGGERDSKWGWAHPARNGSDIDFTFTDPSYMGTLQLD